MDAGVRLQRTVLHVDDEESFTDLTVEYLEQMAPELEVLTATSVREARAYLDVVDCVISDYDMPEVNGLEFLDIVRDHHPELPFILFTGMGSEEIASEAISAGVTDYLQKGSNTEQFTVLANRVTNAISRYRSQRHLDHMLDTLPGVVFRRRDTPGYPIDFVRGHVRELTGFSAEELTTEVSFVETVIHSDDREAIRTLIARTDTDSGPYEATYRLQRKDGTVRWVWERSHNHIASDGEQVSIGMLIDITEVRGQVDADLGTIERLERILEYSTDVVIILDEGGTIEYISPGIIRTIDTDVTEVVGRDVRRFVHEDDIDIVEDAFYRILDNPEEEGIVQFRAFDDAGDVHWFEARGQNFLDDPVIEGIMVNLREITEQKRHQRALQYERDRANALFADLGEPVVEVRFEAGRPVILSMNQAFEETFGLDAAATTGTILDDHIVPQGDESTARSLNEHVKQGTVMEEELVRRTADGSRTFLLRTVPFKTNGERRAYAIYVDISEQKARERELTRQNERLERFSEVISHDMRNPLTVAKGHLDLLKGDIDHDSLDKIEAAHDRLESILEGTLALARQGKTVSETSTVTLAEITSNAWAMVATGDATLEITDDVHFECDPERFQQVFENLFANAIEHAGRGVTVRVGPIDHSTLFVEDDGPGLPDSLQGEVFDSTGTPTIDGSGFGLAIVREIISAHGWSIEMNSQDGGGARFEIGGMRLTSIDAVSIEQLETDDG